MISTTISSPDYEVRIPDSAIQEWLKETSERDIPMFLSGSLLCVDCVNTTLVYRDAHGALVKEETWNERGILADVKFVWYTFR